METLWSPRYSHPNCLLGFRQSNNCADSEVDHHEKLLTIILLLSGAFLYCQPAIGTCIYPIVARLYIILRHMFKVYLSQVRSKIARGACDQPKAGCMGPVVSTERVTTVWRSDKCWQVWDDELARVAQKWADQCVDVDYKDDYKRRDPILYHDSNPNRKIGERFPLHRYC